MYLRLAPLSARTSPLAALGALTLFAGTGLAQLPPVTPAPTVIPGINNQDGFGQSVAAIGDISGDGIMDILVGAPYALDPNNGTRPGAFYVRSGADGSTVVLSGTAPGGAIFGGTNDAEFGYAVSGLDDLVGDSFPELLVGSPAINAAQVFRGKGGGLLYNLPVPTVGNWFVGQAAPFAIAPNLFGYSVADAGDLNGDGVRDIVVGGPSTTVTNPFTGTSNSAAGMAVIYDGATGANMMVQASGNGDFNGLYGMTFEESLGWSVCAAGDWDQDGFDDVAIASRNASVGSGKVSIYSGLWISTVNNFNPPLIPPVIADFYAAPGDLFFGNTMAFGGDMDNDGLGELVVGSLFGATVIKGGSTSSVGSVLHYTPASTGAGGGMIVAAGQDLDGDGTPDYMAGPDKLDATNILGKAVAYSGLTGAPLFTANSAFRASEASCLGMLPDSTGNGKAEVLIGLPQSYLGGGRKGQVSLILR